MTTVRSEGERKIDHNIPVFVVASVRSCHAGGLSLASTFIPSGYTTILATLGGSTLRFGTTTFVVLGWCGRVYQ